MAKSAQDQELIKQLKLDRDRWHAEKDALQVQLADHKRALDERNAQLDAAHQKIAHHKGHAEAMAIDATMSRSERDQYIQENANLRAQIATNRWMGGLR